MLGEHAIVLNDLAMIDEGELMIDFENEYLMQSAGTRIKVVGIGGAGCNMVNQMIKSQYENVEFVVINTDAQTLRASESPFKIQIGNRSTRGHGAGANPEVGKRAAEEDLDKIIDFLKESDIVFLTAGLGGGTGSGAISVIARAVREMGILCVAVVTKPFAFEGKRRMAVASAALDALKKEVDTLIVVPNQKLFDIADQTVSFTDAFGMINNVMQQFVRSISDIISRPGHINVDFADVCAIMRNMGLAVMGIGSASGTDRAEKAALQALFSPLLENNSINGARAVLLNITGSSKLGLHEVHAAASMIHEVCQDANIIMGSVIDESMGDEVVVTVIATGIEGVPQQTAQKVEAPVELRPAQAAGEAQDSMKNHQDQLQNFKGIDPEDLEIPTYLRRAKEKGLLQK